MTAYRVYDSEGTVEVTRTKSRAMVFREQGYPVEVWEVATVLDLLDLGGGSGPHYLSGSGKKVGDLTRDGEVES